jgi:hypothetical protein
VDVDEPLKPEYEENPVMIEEEQNLVQEAGQLEEDTKRTKSDRSRELGPREADKSMGSVPQSHKPKVG